VTLTAGNSADDISALAHALEQIINRKS